MPWGVPAEQMDCPDEASYVHLAASGSCLRYFGPADLRLAPTLIVYMTGDRDAMLNRPWNEIPNNTRRALSARYTELSRRAGVPLVMLARPGTYGSSGNHRLRRRLRDEFTPINESLDVLKRRYGVQRFVLWGHSGGATAAAAMLTMGRTDIGCAVMSSSTFAYLERWQKRRDEDAGVSPRPNEVALARKMYDPLDHVKNVVRDEKRIVYVLGDPRDKVTPFYFQARFAEALRSAGHRIVLSEVEGVPPSFHDLRGDVGLAHAKECATSTQTANG